MTALARRRAEQLAALRLAVLRSLAKPIATPARQPHTGQQPEGTP